jgi:uncharacterized protein
VSSIAALRGSEDSDAALKSFVGVLRQAGLRVGPMDTRTFLEACAVLDPAQLRSLYWAGRAAFCACAEDIPVFDRVFERWFGRGQGGADQAIGPQPAAPSSPGVGSETPPEAGSLVSGRASRLEVLRHRDVGALSEAERQELAQMLSRLTVTPPRRRTRRWRQARRGLVDLRHTLRQELRRVGEPGPLRHRRRGSRARRVVLLVDVSGSMSAYAESFLRLAHRVVAGTPRTVEVFTLGTRLTRVSEALRTREADAAVARAGQAVPDWQGGTRLGEMLMAFLHGEGQREIGRGAVVIVFSDGLERGGTAELSAAMAQLRRLAHRVIWVNPHRGKPGYEPVQAGMAAALPHVDRLVAGHTLAAFEALTAELARA